MIDLEAMEVLASRLDKSKRHRVFRPDAFWDALDFVYPLKHCLLVAASRGLYEPSQFNFTDTLEP